MAIVDRKVFLRKAVAGSPSLFFVKIQKPLEMPTDRNKTARERVFRRRIRITGQRVPEMLMLPASRSYPGRCYTL